MKNILVIVLVITASACFVNNGFAQTTGPGTLDPNFANAGELADSAIFPFRYSGMALSPGDELVITSTGMLNGSDTIQAIRYTYDGNRDVNFGLNASGISYLVTPGFSGSVTSSIVQSDRKILIAGQYAISGNSQKAYLLRLNVDGSLDNTFGTNGWVFFNFLPHFGEFIHQVSLQNNGQIVVLDMGNNPGVTDTLIVARLNTNGSFDSTFAVNGVYQVPFTSFLATSPAIFSLDANNNFTFAAYSNYQSSDYIYLFQLNANGVLNTSYGNGGSILIDSTNIINGGANLGLNFQTDGKLITVQSKQTGTILWAVCRYNADGSIDEGFGNNGLVNVQPNLYPIPYNVANIVETGKNSILVAGIVTVAGANRLIVCSFDADGAPDAGFGNNQGSELLNCFEYDDIIYNMLLQPGGNLVINGMINEVNYNSYEVVRLLAADPTSVKEVNNEIQFSIYPDPATSEIHFELSKPADGNICLTDMTGNLVATQQASNGLFQTLDISNLAAGVYIVTYLDSETSVSKKVIKQ